MASAIDATKPAAGTALTADVRANFTAAKAEIEALQAGTQPLDGLLTALSALVTVADRLIYATGADTVAMAALTAFARTLLDDVDAATARATLGLGTLATQSGTFSGTSSGANTGDQTITLTGPVTGTGTGTFATTITDKAVTYAKIQDLAGTDRVLGRYSAGAGPAEEIAFKALMRNLADDNNAAEARVTLGLPATETATGAATGTINIDWSVAAAFSQAEPTGAITYTFSPPVGASQLSLRIISDGTSTAQTFTWPATVKWLTAAWTAATNKNALIRFWYDGTTYWAKGENEA